MSRAVVPVRLSDAEREQIASAAMREGMTFSAFLRAASLEASARVTRKVSPAREPVRPKSEPVSVPVIEDAEPDREHWCDGEPLHLYRNRSQ
jgi:hypothetical protein